jgi:hypothetical protein
LRFDAPPREFWALLDARGKETNNMKSSIMILVALILAGCGIAAPPEAEIGRGAEPLNAHEVTGSWAGPAYAMADDLNHDGVNARLVDLLIKGTNRFQRVEGELDTELLALGCAPEGHPSLLLRPLGTLTFRGHDIEDELFLEPDPSGPPLCFDFTNPSEVLVLRDRQDPANGIFGGQGLYAGATATATVNLHDLVLFSMPVTLPGFPELPAPKYVDSRAEFTLSVTTQ